MFELFDFTYLQSHQHPHLSPPHTFLNFRFLLAIANAMKALQDKLKVSENQVEELHRQVDTFDRVKKDALDDQRRKFEGEFKSIMEKEKQFQQTIEKLHRELAMQNEEIKRLQGIKKDNDEEVTTCKI